MDKIISSFGLMQMTWGQGVMMLICFVLLYLGIKKQFEPLLLVPIAIGLASYATYSAIKDAGKYKGVSDLKLEIAKKAKELNYSLGNCV